MQVDNASSWLMVTALKCIWCNMLMRHSVVNYFNHSGICNVTFAIYFSKTKKEKKLK